MLGKLPLCPSLLLLALNACTVTSLKPEVLRRGTPLPFSSLKSAAQSQGPIKFRKVVAANWTVDRSGLINLDAPAAKQAHLVDGDEDIQIYFYAIEHPKFGRFFIDSGIADIISKRPEEAPISWLVRKFMKTDRLKVHLSTRSWLEQHPGELSGIFLTHLHLDHVLGIPDLPKGVPLYVGPMEASTKSFQNLFVAGTTDGMLDGQTGLHELEFPPVVADEGPQTVDFFGDGSLFVMAVPGHTAGSLAFLINSEQGPQLIVGDTCHTRWGWEHQVTPGSFTADQKMNAKSLDALETLAKEIPELQVHLGHQSATAQGKLEKP